MVSCPRWGQGECGGTEAVLGRRPAGLGTRLACAEAALAPVWPGRPPVVIAGVRDVGVEEAEQASAASALLYLF